MKKLYFLLFFLVAYTSNAQLVLNETLFDPASDAPGDANGDGTRSASADEFIEFVNNSNSALDITGYKIYDATNFALLPGEDIPNHLVPISTVIPANGIYVLFGGGTPTGIAGDIVQTSTSGNLNLTNSGDVITVTDAAGTVVLTFDSDALSLSMGADQSVMRNPNITGDFVLHTGVNGESYSPGILAADTTPTSSLIINEVLFDPASDDSETTAIVEGDANGDGTRSSSADEFIEFINNSSSDLDISGYKIFDATGSGNDTPRHVVPANTVIPANGIYLLFGGPNPTGTFGGENTIVQTASTENLNLTNGGDVITVKNSADDVILIFDSSSIGVSVSEDQSVTRNPEITGDFVLHTDAIAGVFFSPGTAFDAVLSNPQFNADTLSIYPNPVTEGFVNIRTNNTEIMTVSVIDMLGKQISQSKLTHNQPLDVSELKSGLYILRITQNNATLSKKIVVE
jgi:hypothetical protein